MKAAFVAIGLVASFTSFAVAKPTVYEGQLVGREPLLCIGCISAGKCGELSEPDGCEVCTLRRSLPKSKLAD